jgi:hypothetical protein
LDGAGLGPGGWWFMDTHTLLGSMEADWRGLDAYSYNAITMPHWYSHWWFLLGWAQPDLVVMHSRRWYKLLSAVSASWPMIYQAGGNLPAVATGSNSGLGYAKGIRGQLANGLNVCVDNNVTTVGLAQATTGGTQDHIYVVPSQECHLWEDPQAPVFIRAEQPAAANLGVLLVLYGYFAYSFRRFTNATVVISGTGTVPPVYDGT